MLLRAFTLLAFTMALSTSCSKSKKKLNHHNPSTPTPPLQQISEQHKANFDAWTKKLVKSCNASEAFGLDDKNTPAHETLDAGLVLNANNQSAVFSDQNQLAILTDYDNAYGESQSNAEQVVNINGVEYSIKASAVRKGPKCEVFLYGEKVFETHLVSSFHVGAFWSPEKPTITDVINPSVKTLGTSGAGELQNSGISRSLNHLFAPNEDAHKLISQKLNISTEATAALFKISVHPNHYASVSIAHEESAAWTTASSDSLIANKLFLSGLVDGGEKNISINSAIGINKFTFGQVSNTADQGYLAITFNWLLKKAPTQGIATSANNLVVQGIKPLDKQVALDCTSQRLTAFLGGNYGANMIFPGTNDLIQPCQAFDQEVHESLFTSGWLKTNIANIFERVTPISGFRYNGWYEVVKRLVLEAQTQGQNIAELFDPQSKTVIFPSISQYFTATSHEISGTRGLSTSTGVIFNMVLQWSFNGFKVSESKIHDIIIAVNHAEDPFAVSTIKMLERLSTRPTEFDAEIEFATRMNDEYKNTANQALSLAKELNYQDFETTVFNVSIQKQVSLQEYKDWIDRLLGIRNQISPFGNLGANKGPLVGLSVKWLTKGEIQVQDLSKVYSAFDNLGDEFSSSAQTLLRDLNVSLAAQSQALEYARSISNEFKQLANKVRDQAAALDLTTWSSKIFNSILQTRPSIENLRAWNNTLSSVSSFVGREKERTKGEMGSSHEWHREALVEKAVNETWTEDDFVSVEKIAQVAKHKSICERHKSVSSLIDCVGLNLVSRSSKKFLDPSFEGRYGSLAEGFNQHLNTLNGHKWTTLRWNLLDAFFDSSDVIWSKCDKSTFNSKSSQVDTLIKTIAVEPNQGRIWELERQIKDQLENCR